MATMTVFYDRVRKGHKWTTIVKDDTNVQLETHATERLAREHIGLEGGSQDPDYMPKGTGSETVSDA